jgi:hypothetical protein
MGYKSINNLHKDPDVMSTGKELYETEKIHGTSTNILLTKLPQGEVAVELMHGGLKSAASFAQIVEKFLLLDRAPNMFSQLSASEVQIFGEGYGGNVLQMGKTYGPEIRFVAFEVFVTHTSGKTEWLTVPEAEKVARIMGCDFVPWSKIPSTWEAVDKARNQPSRLAARIFPEGDGRCEGVVLRPLVETVNYDNETVRAKHKQSWARENKALPVRGAKYDQKLASVKELAQEWVTVGRLAHVLDHLRARGVACTGPQDTRAVIEEMVADVKKEAGVDTQPLLTEDVCKAMGRMAAGMFLACTKNPDGFCFDMPTEPGE